MEPVGRIFFIKAVGEGVADIIVGVTFTPRCDMTGILDIDGYHPLFDMPLPIIHHIVILPPHDREELLKRISDEDTMVLHYELASKGVPAVIDISKNCENTSKLYFNYIMW